MDSHYFDCRCGSVEHTLRFTRLDEDDEIYAHVFLSNDGFFKRLYAAIKYVLGYKCMYGHFGEWILQDCDRQRLVDLVNVRRPAKIDGGGKEEACVSEQDRS